MKISYNWLKWYIPEVPEPDKLADIFTYHIAEVEGVEKKEDDTIFDINILPNRAHDLLSHQGIARELASLLNIKYVDSAPEYKIPASVKALAGKSELKIDIQSDKCRRYMGRIIRNVKVGSSPEWVVKHLESIGQRSINNLVDAANILMYDCGQPAHVFDLDKVEGGLVIRNAKIGEKMTTLDNRDLELSGQDLLVADFKMALGLAGIKGGKIAEVTAETKNVIIEIANFDPIVTRKSAVRANIFTDARKRFENDLSPELGPYAMRELSALIFEMCPEAIFEDIVDVYPHKQGIRKLSFSADKISKILGLKVSVKEIEDILKRYNFQYKENKGKFEILPPPMRLDLEIEEDMAEEIGRILGYDKVKGEIPEINFKPKINETYKNITFARNKLLSLGYNEVMTYTFSDKGEIELKNSASDKKFLRTNLSDGLRESIKLNQLNAQFLGMNEIKVFEIGTIFKKGKEELHVAYGDKKEVKEMSLAEYTKSAGSFLNGLAGVGDPENRGPEKKTLPMKFQMWSLFPFIARDIAVFAPEGIKSVDVAEVIKENMGNMVTRGPELFDEFKKGGKTSYAFRLIFQSYDRTLTDAEVGDIMTKITNKIKENSGWEVR
ncbi:hypothetical protein A2641_01755 [Candidatus Nomurabacteria bacterium RIFCSPHIGHO2_01_FULL_37_25]|nr:MAG: hypothetical protein A2641_01755 [Candidatus Nomurabacteria bacterium RIFCSPHIGHO2_01_FULL_37_25]